MRRRASSQDLYIFPVSIYIGGRLERQRVNWYRLKQGDEVYGQAGVVTGGQEHLQKWL